MKKIMTAIVLVLVIASLSIMLIACNEAKEDTPLPNEDSEPEVNEDEQQESQDKDSDTINPMPPEVMAKVHEIYSKASHGPQTITSVQGLATITSINYTIEGAGPISITPAKLNGEEITLITLGGTQFVEGQATTIKESQLAAQGKSNDYLKALLGLFMDGTVPDNKPILVTGISLGGMIAQQVIGEEYIRENYDIKGIITFGSPLTRPLERYGVKVVRFQDKSDMVPSAGEIMLGNKNKVNSLNQQERILKVSKYKDPIETHALSYIEDECWNDYDFMGDKNKTNTLVLMSDMTFYPAPSLS